MQSFGKNLPKTFVIKNEQALAFGLKPARFVIVWILNFQLAENIFCNSCFNDKQ